MNPCRNLTCNILTNLNISFIINYVTVNLGFSKGGIIMMILELKYIRRVETMNFYQMLWGENRHHVGDCIVTVNKEMFKIFPQFTKSFYRFVCQVDVQNEQYNQIDYVVDIKRLKVSKKSDNFLKILNRRKLVFDIREDLTKKLETAIYFGNIDFIAEEENLTDLVVLF